jgi:hypothetical protein
MEEGHTTGQRERASTSHSIGACGTRLNAWPIPHEFGRPLRLAILLPDAHHIHLSLHQHLSLPIVSITLLMVLLFKYLILATIIVISGSLSLVFKVFVLSIIYTHAPIHYHVPDILGCFRHP